MSGKFFAHVRVPFGTPTRWPDFSEHLSAPLRQVDRQSRLNPLNCRQGLTWHAAEGPNASRGHRKRLAPASRIAHHKDRIGVRQVHRQKMDLAINPADYIERFAKMDVRISWRMDEWNKKLFFSPLSPKADVSPSVAR